MGPRSYGGRPQQSITVGVKSTQKHCRERLQQVFATQNWIRGTRYSTPIITANWKADGGLRGRCRLGRCRQLFNCIPATEF